MYDISNSSFLLFSIQRYSDKQTTKRPVPFFASHVASRYKTDPRLVIFEVCSSLQGPHCKGKTGKIAPKILCQRKHRKFWKFGQNTGKTQMIWFAQVVDSLVLKMYRIL